MGRRSRRRGRGRRRRAVRRTSCARACARLPVRALSPAIPVHARARTWSPSAAPSTTCARCTSSAASSTTRRATTAFEHGVRTALGFQGPRGEWPWLISVSRGHALDVYPVYSVHQLAMAMLFLLPALDDGAVEGDRAGDQAGASAGWPARTSSGSNSVSASRSSSFARSSGRAAAEARALARAECEQRARRATPETPARRTRINPNGARTKAAGCCTRGPIVRSRSERQPLRPASCGPTSPRLNNRTCA